jgi:hypothetical protein
MQQIRLTLTQVINEAAQRDVVGVKQEFGSQFVAGLLRIEVFDQGS